MKFFRSLNSKFSDPKMEKEYTAIRNQNAVIDFQVTACAIILVTLSVSIEKIITPGWPEFITATSTIALFILIYFIQKLSIFRNYVEYLTITILIVYNVYRLVIFKYVYYSNLRAAIWFSGYTFAILQMIMISRFPGNLWKIFAVVIAYVLRFGVIIGAIDSAAAQPGSLIRAVIVDVFILFYYYFNDRTDRRIFQNFYENREELLKFKELLADFPQCVTVVDSSSIKPLFSNTTFLTTFDKSQTAGEPLANTESSLVKVTHMNSNIEPTKSDLNCLRVDQTSIREAGTNSPPSVRGTHYTNEIVYLNEMIEDLVRQKILHEKSVSLTATLLCQEDRKSFAVTLKRVKWDRTDAVAVILNDITYQENVIALKTTIENKDKIIATVAHELRTPLNSIIGLLSLAQKNVVHHEALKYVLLSRDNAQLLLSLVNSHLDFQMMKAGKLRINPLKIDIAKVLNDIIQLLQFQTGQKGIYLKSHLLNEEVPRFITTDENRLKQILLNLIGNAIKFTSTGGIRIEVCQDIEESKCLKISVIDTGIGIRKEDKGKLFQMYERLEEGRNVNKNGVGLGLMISNALALLMSGKTDGKGIEVESEHGVGSTFSFKILKDLSETAEVQGQSSHNGSYDFTTYKKQKALSFQKESEKLERKKNKGKQDISGEYEEEEPTTPINMNSNYVSRTNNQDLTKHQKRSTIDKLGMTDYRNDSLESDDRRRLIDTSIIQQSPQKNNILVVDDNPFNLLVTENILKEMGYSVKTVLGGKDAIEVVKNFTKDGKFLKAILMDCHMPGMDGYETSRELRRMMSRNEIQKIPIIAMTANNDDEEEAKKCFDAGMNGYLTKSSPPDDIKKAFAKLEL